jgi:hypothetical protein
MKRTIILSAMLVAAMSTATLAEGNGDKSSKAALIPSQVEGRYNLIYADATPGMVKVKIMDEEGHVLRVDRIDNKRGFKRPYNMTDLGPGTYQVVVSDKDGEFTLMARVQELEEMGVNQLGDSKYQLVYKDPKSNGATIGIFDQTGELVHSESITFNKGFSKVFDLSGISSKGFTFEVSSSNSSKRVSM